LIKQGFQSQSLEKHKPVLQAYMLKLEESGLLAEEERLRTNRPGEMPWWARSLYMESMNSLGDLTLRDVAATDGEAALDR
jgi:hypothetical protein